MELKLYLKIFQRWWWLIVLPAVLIGLVGIITYKRPTLSYNTKIRFSASATPSVNATPGFDPTYYSWITSEYLVGALSDWSKTGAFAQAISDELAKQNKTIPPNAIQASLASDYVRSTLTIYVNGGDADNVSAIANAATTVLQKRNAEIFPQLGGKNAVVTALDTPQINASALGLRDSLDLPIRLLLGLGVGIACALVAHYFDPFVREKNDLAELNVLAEIPKN